MRRQVFSALDADHEVYPVAKPERNYFYAHSEKHLENYA